MTELIQQTLARIEAAEEIRILYAVESGSRAWGFPSPDSDYDVRFIYVRKPEYYLKLEKTRDVVELPINDLLDVNGWDLNKTLRLLQNSNPTLFEWMSSPIVYRSTDFIRQIQPELKRCFSCKSSLHHYLSTARNTCRHQLHGDTVRAKKYFYALRPVLACKWILEYQSQPPMLFSELVDACLEPELKGEVERLLDLKMNAPEIREILPVEPIHRYLEENLASLEAQIAACPAAPAPDWEPLNRLFLEVLGLEL